MMAGRTTMHPALKSDGKVYTIRKGGKIIVRSTIPACGYSPEELRSLRAAGFQLYADDKLIKR